jgi:5-methyltetrahydrofolate--homocysteine methyltransferase
MDRRDEERIYQEVISGLVELKAEEVKRAIHEGLAKQLDPLSIQENGLRKGLEHLGQLFEKGEVFIPHLMFGAKVFNDGIELLKPHMLKNQPPEALGTVVIGTVAGDLHDLGKNIVTLMWKVSGFRVIDLGTNVTADAFLKAVSEHKANLLGLSALLTTTMMEQKSVIEALIRANMRKQVKVLVGGAPVTDTWAKEIGADGFGKDAGEAVRIAKKMVLS